MRGLKVFVTVLVWGFLSVGSELPTPTIITKLGKPVFLELGFTTAHHLAVVTTESVRIYDLPQGEVVAEMTFCEPPTGARIASGVGLMAVSFSNRVEVYKLPELTLICAMPLERFRTTSPLPMTISPSGDIIAFAYSGILELREIPSGNLRSRQKLSVSLVDEIHFLSGQEIVLNAYPSVHLLNLAIGKTRELARLPFRSRVAVDVVRRWLIHPTRKGARIVDVDTGEVVAEYEGRTGSALDTLVISPEGLFGLAVYDPLGDVGLEIFKMRQEAEPLLLTVPDRSQKTTWRVALTEGFAAMAAESVAGYVSLYVWELDGGELIYSLPDFAAGRWGGTLAASPDGSLVAFWSPQELKVVDVSQGKVIARRQEFGVSVIAFHPERPMIGFVAGYGTEVVLWNWESGEVFRERATLLGKLGRVGSLLFLPGEKLLLGDSKGNLAVVNVPQLTLEHLIEKAHEERVVGLFYLAPQGKVVSVSPASVLLWDPTTWSVLDEVDVKLSTAWKAGDLIIARGTMQEWFVFTVEADGRLSYRQVAATQERGVPATADRLLLLYTPEGERCSATVLKVFSLRDGKLLSKWELPPSIQEVIVLSPPRRLALIAQDGRALVATLNQPPRVSISVKPPYPSPGEEVMLSVQVDDPEGDPIRKIRWEAAGQIIEGESITIKFQEEGTYVVSVEVEDAEGATASARAEISVAFNRPPEARFVIVPPDPWAGESVAFLDRSFDPEGMIVRKTWFLNREKIGQESIVFYTFSEPGTYTVALEVVDHRGAKSRAEIALEVKPAAIISGLPWNPSSEDFYRVTLPKSLEGKVAKGQKVEVIRREITPEGDLEVTLVATGYVATISRRYCWVYLADVRTKVQRGDVVIFQ